MTARPARASRTCCRRAARACRGSRSTTRCWPTRPARNSCGPSGRGGAGQLDPFVLVLEGSVPTSRSAARATGRRSASTPRPASRSPPTLDRPARPAGRRGAGAGNLRRLRRHSGHARQPDRRDGAARLPGPRWTIAARAPDRQPARLPGAARQHHRDAVAPGAAPGRRRADDRARRAGPSELAVRADRAGGLRPGGVRRAGRIRRRSPATVAAAWSSSAARGRWSSATSRSGAGRPASAAARTWAASASACTMPGFPDRFMPFMEPSRSACSRPAGPVHLRAGDGHLRRRAIEPLDLEPEWRRRGTELRRDTRRAGERRCRPVIFRCDFCGALPDPLTQLSARAPDSASWPSASIWRSRPAAGWCGSAAARSVRAATPAPSTAAS